jgi:hypothetical protein
VVGSVFLCQHDGGAGRNVMVYLVTKRLKYPPNAPPTMEALSLEEPRSLIHSAMRCRCIHALYTVEE